jgi:serine/threonine-protein kinase
LSKLVIPEGAREKLDRFELIAEIASGGMATVFLARLGGVGGFQRLYAIKRLHPHLATDGEFIQMFLDEARLAARIHHPNVVPILEIGMTSSGYYLVMEYIEGDTAARLFARSAMAGRRVPTNVGIRIVLDVLGGLHAAHEQKDDDGKPLEIVHRDVSPQNILVGVDGIARITDFGVARAATRLSTTRSGQLKGKLAYMAPEQARAGSIDRRADVFAMGICLWETLACKRLFKGEGEAETLHRVLYEPIPQLRSVLPTVPSALNDVCMKALDRDPAKRFATAAEFADALERAAVSLRVLGSHRDVVACVDETMGAEIVQQRDAVRAWLAKCEGNELPRSVPPPPSHESVTKIERAASSVTPPAVSSVSSATLQVPPASETNVSATADANATSTKRSSVVPARRRRRGAWVAVVAVAAALAVVGAKYRGNVPRAWSSAQTTAPTLRERPDLAPPEPVQAIPAQAAPSPAAPSEKAGPTLTSAPAALPAVQVAQAAKDASVDAHAGPANTPASTPRTRHRPQGASPAPVKPVEPETDPAAQPAASGLPDDISHNPSR